MLSRSFNNTYIMDQTAPCDTNVSHSACYARYGGQFDEGSSTTYTAYPNLTAAGLVPVGSDDHQRGDIAGTDLLTLNANLSLPDYAVGIYRGDSHDYITGPGASSLGLSSNSTILRALVTSGSIDSRTFGFSYGWVGADAPHQIDGGLVLGGYDEAKQIGSGVTLPITYSTCTSGLMVTISDITMNLVNGSDVSISDKQAITACVNLDKEEMSLPYAIWSRFLSVSGSVETGRSMGIDFWTMLVDASSA